jgi:uncharacterized protein (DUF433 family)/DNA-binding transcriptional MerR regulator
MVTIAAPREDEPASRSHEAMRGVYDTRRTAALSGVPERTLRYWAANGFYRPSISPEPRTRLWSWYDLIALRVIDWLRQPKDVDRLPRVSPSKIRQSLEELDRQGLSPADLHNLVAQSRDGDLFITVGERAVRVDSTRQMALPGVLPLVHPYRGGPDLLEPRPLLRIIPGKLHGEPHLVDTRIPSATIYALYQEGYELEKIAAMYPEVPREALEQSIDLESSLSQRAA